MLPDFKVTRQFCRRTGNFGTFTNLYRELPTHTSPLIDWLRCLSGVAVLLPIDKGAAPELVELFRLQIKRSSLEPYNETGYELAFRVLARRKIDF